MGPLDLDARRPYRPGTVSPGVPHVTLVGGLLEFMEAIVLGAYVSKL